MSSSSYNSQKIGCDGEVSADNYFSVVRKLPEYVFEKHHQQGSAGCVEARPEHGVS